MDNELFELCKEVSEKTKWSHYTLKRYVLTPVKLHGQDDYSKWKLVDANYRGNTAVGHIPLYISDFLLEKLPYQYGGRNLEIVPRKDGTWYAGYSQGEEFSDTDDPNKFMWSEADTPLKALLKLTLALHEAGELK